VLSYKNLARTADLYSQNANPYDNYSTLASV
jgi:hypothetical protein